MVMGIIKRRAGLGIAVFGGRKWIWRADHTGPPACDASRPVVVTRDPPPRLPLYREKVVFCCITERPSACARVVREHCTAAAAPERHKAITTDLRDTLRRDCRITDVNALE